VAFFTLFALVWPPGVCRHDMWQKKASDPEHGFNAEENASAR
jgi:hypothetical protein